MRIVSSTRANERLIEIGNYWTKGVSREQALGFTTDLVKQTLRLIAFPEAYPVLYARANPPPPRAFRKLAYRNYKIIHVYVEERKEIVIVDYWHDARRRDSLLEELDRVIV